MGNSPLLTPSSRGLILSYGYTDISLTHICLVDPSILINWTRPFPILEMSGLRCHFYSIANRYSCLVNSENPDQTPRFAASDLGLHCLPMSHEWDSRLIWVSLCFTFPFLLYIISCHIISTL